MEICASLSTPSFAEDTARTAMIADMVAQEEDASTTTLSYAGTQQREDTAQMKTVLLPI